MCYGLWQRQCENMASGQSYQPVVHINAYTCFYDDVPLYMAEKQFRLWRLDYHSGASAGYRRWFYQCLETAEKLYEVTHKNAIFALQ